MQGPRDSAQNNDQKLMSRLLVACIWYTCVLISSIQTVFWSQHEMMLTSYFISVIWHVRQDQ